MIVIKKYTRCEGMYYYTYNIIIGCRWSGTGRNKKMRGSESSGGRRT